MPHPALKGDWSLVPSCYSLPYEWLQLVDGHTPETVTSMKEAQGTVILSADEDDDAPHANSSNVLSAKLVDFPGHERLRS